MKILVCPQHTLTDSQIADLEGMEVHYLKNVNNTLFGKLSRLNGDEDLELLSRELIGFIREGNYYHVMMPIGSPAFQAIFFTIYSKLHVTDNYFIPNFYFSHTDRKVVETTQPDGTVTKTSIFEHKKYIIF